MASLIDRPPSKWMAALFRAPVGLFRWRLGWVLGGRLVMLNHVGRRTGRERVTVLEVLFFEADPPTWYVAAAWGKRSDWYRNLAANPQAVVTTGRRRYPVTARLVDTEEAVRIHNAYVRNHPWAARLIGSMIGIDLVHEDPTRLAGRVPLVALHAEAGVNMSGASEIAPVVTTRAETRATYDRIARYYELVEGFWERRARTAGLAALSAGPGESLFEIGCGPGYSLVELAQMVWFGGRAIGVDLSFNMCLLAHRRLDRHAVGATGAVVQGDAVGLPFPAGCFDAGFMSFTLELFDTPQIPAVLAECRRVLRPRGRLAVVALSKEEPGTLMQRTYERGHASFPRLLDCRPIHVDRVLIDAGFTVVEERALSLWGLPIAVVVAETPGG